MSEPANRTRNGNGELKIYFLPNLFTTGNLFCGFLALTIIVAAPSLYHLEPEFTDMALQFDSAKGSIYWALELILLAFFSSCASCLRRRAMLFVRRIRCLYRRFNEFSIPWALRRRCAFPLDRLAPRRILLTLLALFSSLLSRCLSLRILFLRHLLAFPCRRPRALP